MDKKLVIGINVESSAAKASLDELRDAAVRFGDDGAKHAEGLTRSVENADRQFDAFERKLNDTGLVGERDIRKIAAAIELMKANGEKAFGSLANAPRAFTAALDQAEAKLRTANTAVGRITDAVKDNAANVQAAGGHWSGLGNAIESTGGKQAVAVAGFGLFTAALREGWEIGQKLNKTFGTDMSLWDEAVTRLGAKVAAIVRATADNIQNFTQVVYDLVTGNLTNLKRDVQIFVDDAKKSFTTGIDAITKYGDEWDRLHPPISKATEAVNAHTAAVLKLVAAEGIFGEAVATTADYLKRTAEATEKLQKKIDDTTDSIKKETGELTKNTNAMIEAEHVVVQRTSDMEYFAREIKRANEAIEEQRHVVDAETAAHGRNDPMTLQAIERQRQLEGALETANRQYQRAHDDVEEYRKKQDAATQAVQSARDHLNTLNTELQSQMAALANLPNQIGFLATNTDKLATAAGRAAPETHNLAIGLQQTAQHGQPAAIAAEKVAAAASNVATSLSTGKIVDALKVMRDLETTIGGIRDRMNEARTAADALVTSLENVAAAAEKAEGKEAA